jgi:hypothetical protein
MEAIVRELCARVPRAIGAVLCDFEGESVVCALGSERAPPEAEARAKDHVPKTMSLTMPVAEFLVRLAAAEPCALLRMFQQSSSKGGVGQLAMLEMRYEEVEMLVQCLPNDFYVVLVLRRPAITAEARNALSRASKDLAPLVT